MLPNFFSSRMLEFVGLNPWFFYSKNASFLLPHFIFTSDLIFSERFCIDDFVNFLRIFPQIQRIIVTLLECRCLGIPLFFKQIFSLPIIIFYNHYFSGSIPFLARLSKFPTQWFQLSRHFFPPIEANFTEFLTVLSMIIVRIDQIFCPLKSKSPPDLGLFFWSGFWKFVRPFCIKISFFGQIVWIFLKSSKSNYSPDHDARFFIFLTPKWSFSFLKIDFLRFPRNNGISGQFLLFLRNFDQFWFLIIINAGARACLEISTVIWTQNNHFPKRLDCTGLDQLETHGHEAMKHFSHDLMSWEKCFMTLW